jgi:2-haloacid dehalogenase
MQLTLTDFDAVTFDVYGTLIDWEPAITAFLSDWAGRKGLSVPGADLLMAFDQARRQIQLDRPAYLYPDVLRRSFDRICAEYTVEPDVETREAFALSPHAWPGYPDSHAALVALQKQAKICALSNIDEASLQASSAKLGITFDLLVTAQRVGAYKPDAPHFDVALTELAAMGIPRSRILHVAQSLRADIVPANRLGLTSVWVHRPDRVMGLTGAADARPDLEVASMAELVAMIIPG